MGEALVDLLPVDDGLLRPVPGGSCYNVALALARFEAPVAFVGRLSNDEPGQLMFDALARLGVDVALVGRDPRPSPLSFIERGTAGGQARYNIYLAETAHAPPDLAGDWLAKAGHLHVSSFSAICGVWGEAVAAALREAEGRISCSFDINIRARLLPPRAKAAALVEERVALVSVVKASEEDLAWLYPGQTPEAVGLRWAQDGRIVLLTRGAAGAAAFHNGALVACPAPKIDVVDTIGAGDAFLAAFLAQMHSEGVLDRGAIATLDRERLHAALRFATIAGALTCTRAGAMAPTPDQIRALDGVTGSFVQSSVVRSSH
ncbi:carbohydrate kinase family protein [Bradyrhizobium sp.]|uniref:carbohydrate kinase family protein n=1 Tax=Bradyrhizobium sp. TaxID=376 RepID=UPI003C76FA2F